MVNKNLLSEGIVNIKINWSKQKKENQQEGSINVKENEI